MAATAEEEQRLSCEETQAARLSVCQEIVTPAFR
jgi:hypothetical protein